MSVIDKLVGKETKEEVKIIPVENIETPESNEPELQIDTPDRTKRDKISDEILDVMLSDDHLEKMTHLNSRSAMVFARADTIAEVFKSKTLAMFTKKSKQHLVSNKRLGRTEVGDVLNNVGDTVDDSMSVKEKLFGDNF